MNRKILIGLVLCLCVTQTPAQQRTRADSPDEGILQAARPVASGECVELLAHNVPVEPRFLDRLEDACAHIGKIFGRTFDKATLGDKLKVVVTDATNVSHVWHGYQHRKNPRGVLFLSRGAYFGAMRGQNATYAHELTHLFTWRFFSHTLREGLADYVALEIMPGGVVGPNANGYDWTGRIPAEVVELLGTLRDAPDWVSSDARLRQAYYFGSYRFVKLLIEKNGLGVFMQLYAEQEPEEAFVTLYGKSRLKLIEELGL
jgi:hypothetical protein